MDMNETNSSRPRPSSSNDNLGLENIINHAFSNASKAIVDAVSLNRNTCSPTMPTSSNPRPLVHVRAERLSSSLAQDSSTPNLGLFSDSDDDFQKDHLQLKLPSFVGRRNTPASIKNSTRRRASYKLRGKVCHRDIMCLPYEYHQLKLSGNEQGLLRIPRGECRQKLCSLGLVGKLALCRSSSPGEINEDIRRLFSSCFVEETFAYCFLTCYSGTKMLSKPKVSQSFRWDGNAVMSLGRSIIYIAAHAQHTLKCNLQLCDTKSPEATSSSTNETKSVNDDGNALTVEVCTNAPLAGVDCNVSLCDDTSTSSEIALDFNNDADDRHLSLYDNYVSLINYGDESSDDTDLQQAIEASLVNEDNQTRDEEVDHEVSQIHLRELHEQILENKVNLFNINRVNTLDGAVRAIKRKSFLPLARISVKFSDDDGRSEGAVDAGGPTREFFRLLMQCIDNSCIFEGPSASKLISRNLSAVEKDLYYVYGVAISLSLLHGGPGPNFFSELLYAQISESKRKYIDGLDSMSNSAVRQKISKIKYAATEEEMEEALDAASDYLDLCGEYRGAVLASKMQVVEKAVKFYTEDRVGDCFNRFKSGLDVTGLLARVQQHPLHFKHLFVEDTKKLTSTLLVDEVFKYDLSEVGSNTRTKENNCIAFWRDFVIDVEENESTCSLQDIVVFATGADRIPPLGFSPSSSLQFDDTSRFPTANTCANILVLPLIHNNYLAFKNAMEFGIANSPGFQMA